MIFALAIGIWGDPIPSVRFTLGCCLCLVGLFYVVRWKDINRQWREGNEKLTVRLNEVLHDDQTQLRRITDDLRTARFEGRVDDEENTSQFIGYAQSVTAVGIAAGSEKVAQFWKFAFSIWGFFASEPIRQLFQNVVSGIIANIPDDLVLDNPDPNNNATSLDEQIAAKVTSKVPALDRSSAFARAVDAAKAARVANMNNSEEVCLYIMIFFNFALPIMA